MTFESRKTYYFQVGIYFRAIVDYLQYFPVKRRTLVAPQPFGIHVAEQTAKGTVDELIQRHFFKFCQSRVAVSENPVHGMAFLIEYHLDICEGKWKIIKAAVILAVFFLR